MITPVDTVIYYQNLLDYVSKKLGAPVELVHRKTYEEMDRMLGEGRVDAAFICSASYIKDRRDFGINLLVAPQVKGSVYYRSYLIVHKDSDIRSFDDLKGKTFAFTDPKSNTGKLFPQYILAKKGKRPEEFFRRYIYSYSHNKSIELVAKKVVDGAAVDSLVFDYMKEKGSPYTEKIRIIEISPDFGAPPIVAARDVPLFLKVQLQEIFRHMHLDPEGKKILDSMLIDRFVEVPDSNYDTIREMETFVSTVMVPEETRSRETDTIYFGILPRENPRIAFEKYQPVIDYLTEKTPYTFELILKKTYEETINALGSGDIDFALLEPLTYLEAHARFGVISLLKSVTEKGESFYRSVVVARSDRPVRRLSDLKGMSFAFASIKSTAGNLMPRYILADAGIHLKDLGNYRNFRYHDSVVKWVLKGEYDAGAVRESTAKKYIPIGIKIIASSEPIPTDPVVVRPTVPYDVIEKVKDVLMGMNRSDKGKELLLRLDPEMRGGFTATRDSDYEAIRKMINKVPETCGIGCHPRIRL
jgi:phosphonate transport system substrate-binding protein